MPLENTSRWPALGELLGHEVVAGLRSWPAGGSRRSSVLAASTRISIVPACERVEEDVAERARAVDVLADLGDDGGRALVNGRTCICAARTDRPRNMKPSSVPMITSVDRAFFHSGFLNAGTPLEMASTPVTAAPPEANAGSTTKSAAPIRKPVARLPNGDHARCVARGLDRQVRR